MEMEQNKTFFHGRYSNLTPYLFLSKNIQVFQRLSKSTFHRFKTKVNENNENEAKSDIFSRDIFKSDIIFHLSLNISMTFISGSFQFHCTNEHK